MAGNSSNQPSTPESPTSGGAFNTDQLPFTSRTSDHFPSSSDDDEAAVDPEIIRDEPEELHDEEEEGEDLYNDNFMELVASFDGFLNLSVIYVPVNLSYEV